jgi:hypothetical protein
MPTEPLHSNPTSAFLAPLKQRWLRPKHLHASFKHWRNSKSFRVEEFGKSEEGRPLFVLYWGSGSQRILAWTQMHGNEPTATLALHDLLIDMETKGVLAEAETQVQLAIVFMLNPDGSERFIRRNALGIDLNRDAVAQQSAEIKAFMALQKDFKPHWAFNLHDQRNIYSVGNSGRTATISFLAPAPDFERSIPPQRKASMQLIAGMHEKAESIFPNHYGRYNDEFYPRALGDNLTKDGISTILIEAGHFPGDTNRDKARMLLNECFRHALVLVANGKWKDQKISDYHLIPANEEKLRDVMLRGIKYRACLLDIALMEKEIPNFESGELDRIYTINDIGDLSALHGILEIKGGDLTVEEELSLDIAAHFTLQNQFSYQFIRGKLLPA